MIRSENRRKRPKFEKFPVKFPVSREFDPETGSPLTGSSASYYVLDIAYIIVFLGSLFSREFAGVTGLVFKAIRGRDGCTRDFGRGRYENLVPRQGRPLQPWKIFLRNHVEEIASIDLFAVPTIAFQQLFAFLVLGHRRRQLLWFAVTQNPTAEWLARQITEAFPWETAPKYLIRDNDRAFGGTFKARVRAMGIRDRPTSFRSPWQNCFAERLIGSIRRECTDHLIVFSADHLRRILAKYAIYYNEMRTHVSLGKDAHRTRPIERFGDWRATSSLRSNLDFGSDSMG